MELEGFREREPRLIHEAQQAQSDLQLVKGELGRVQVKRGRGECGGNGVGMKLGWGDG